MKNKDILNFIDPKEIINEEIKKILELQQDVISRDKITLENQMTMFGTAIELNRISKETPEIYNKYEFKADELWNKWFEKNQTMLENNLEISIKPN